VFSLISFWVNQLKYAAIYKRQILCESEVRFIGINVKNVTASYLVSDKPQRKYQALGYLKGYFKINLSVSLDTAC
jgi:hypothetical protein